jgi:NAD(P) transhydrogenase
MMSEHYDFVVIGAGPAGEKAAAQAAYFGKTVAIVEKSPQPGGAAVTNAGIPTKTLRETALYVTGFRQRDVYGLGLELAPDAALSALRARTQDVVNTMVERVRENLVKHRVRLIRGRATLEGDRRVGVEAPTGERTALTAGAILLAPGSRPLRPGAIPFDDPDVHDSETILDVDRPFRSLVVMGAGPIGCEFASIFTALGVDVTVLDQQETPLRFLDSEISSVFKAIQTDLGVMFRLSSGRASVRRHDGRLVVTLPSGEEIPTDKVLFAAGRVGNTADLGLEEVGVDVNERGHVIVDDSFQTTVPGIYAAGDVLGPPGLASVSMEQGRVAACRAFCLSFKETVDPLYPIGIYAIPEIGAVGLSEEAATAEGIDYETGRCWFRSNTRAIISGTSEGLLKLIFRRDDRRLLGVHVIGDIAAELIHEGQAVLHHGGTLDYFIHSTSNVPTHTEAYKYAAYDGLQRLNTSQEVSARTGRDAIAMIRPVQTAGERP